MYYMRVSLILYLLVSACWGQNVSKDSLFLVDENNSFDHRINYENNHSFLFKDIDFVSSAFGERITPMKMSYFTESYHSKGELKNMKPPQVYDIKEYLHANRSLLIHQESNTYDCYKIMLHFDQYHVFIRNNESFIEVVYGTTLQE